MSPYGKLAQTAIAAMSRLAEGHEAESAQRMNSADIAESRGLPQPIVAKVLTVLSQAGLIRGSPGPGGGYALAQPPGCIRLLDVVRLFDRHDDELMCPFGPQWCGSGPQCPLHDQLSDLRARLRSYLEVNTFAAFSRNSTTP